MYFVALIESLELAWILTDNTLDTLLTRDEIGTPMMTRIRNHLPEESQYLLSGRVQLIK